MRIAMVLRLFSLHGGLELYAFQLVKGLLQRDHHVTVICESDETDFAHPHLTVRKFAPAAKGLSKSQKNRHYYEVASKAVADAGPFDVVHSQHLGIAEFDAVTFHNHTVFRLSEVGLPWERQLNNFKVKFAQDYRSREEIDGQLCHRGRCLIFPARTMADDFSNHYKFPSHLIAYVHPGASLPKSIEPKAAGTDKTFNFLFVGKGYRKKGLDILLSACAQLKRKTPDFKLVIAGLRQKPLSKLQLSLLGISKQVQYLGFQKDMNAVYQNAHSIILPSRIEPFGMAPIEGMLAGLVPIVSQVCGVAEVLTDNVDSLILKNHLSAQELSDHMYTLMSNRQKWSTMSQQAAITASKFTWEATVEQTLQAYSTIAVQH